MRSGREVLAEAVEAPKDKAQEQAQEDGRGEGEVDRPASTPPGHVARKPTKGKVGSAQKNHGQPGNNKQSTGDEEQATERRHGISGYEHRARQAQQVRRLARFAHDR